MCHNKSSVLVIRCPGELSNDEEREIQREKDIAAPKLMSTTLIVSSWGGFACELRMLAMLCNRHDLRFCKRFLRIDPTCYIVNNEHK